MGPKTTILLVPIVAWMMWQCDVRWYPGLVMLMAVDGYHMYAYLIISLLLVIIKKDQLNIYHHIVKYLLFFLIIPVPFLIYIFFRNLEFFYDSPSGAIAPLILYLSVFPFFYSLLIAPQFTKQTSQQLIYVFMILMVFQFFTDYVPDEENRETIRAVFLAIPIIFCCVAYGLFNQKFLWFTFLGGILIAAYGLSGIGNTLTLLASGLLTVLILVVKRAKFQFMIRWASSIWPLIVSMMFVAIVVANVEKYTISAEYKGLSYEELSTDWSLHSFLLRLQMKTFDDRASLWKASWDEVIEPPYLIPPIMPKPIVYYLTNGRPVESDMAAHNTPLNIFRTLRLSVGLFLLLGYCVIFILGSRILRLTMDNDDALLPIMAGVIVVGIVGFTTGHYPLMVTFSFVFMSLFGIGYGLYSVRRKNAARSVDLRVWGE